MPKELHRKLERQARKKGLTGEEKNRYVHGTMQKKEFRQMWYNVLLDHKCDIAQEIKKARKKKR